MKKNMFFLTMIIFTQISFAQEKNKTSSFLGKEKYDSMTVHQLRNQVEKLETAVQRLEQRVLMLEVGTTSNQGNFTTCYIKIPFGEEMVMATEPTETAARAKVLVKCSKKVDAIHCKENEVKCGK